MAYGNVAGCPIIVANTKSGPTEATAKQGALSAPPEDDDDDENERVSERVHRSTRALRASVVASGGKMCGVPSAGGIPPEMEPGEKDGAKDDDDEGGTRRRRRLALTIQVMSMVAAHTHKHSKYWTLITIT